MPHFVKQATLFLVLLFATTFHAQKKVLDSLETALKTHTKADTVRVNLLNNIASRVFQTDADKALVLLKESGTLSDQLHYAPGKAKSLLFTGNATSEKVSDQTLVLKYYADALEVYQTLGDKVGMSSCYHNFGRIYFRQGDYKKAESNYKTAIALAEEANSNKRFLISMRGLGMVYSETGEYENAMEIYTKAVAMDLKTGNKAGLAYSYNNLGTAYKRQGKFAVALDYYTKALELNTEVGDNKGICAALSNVGGVYALLKRNEDATNYFNKAIALADKINDKYASSAFRINLALVEMDRGRFTEARQALENALEFFRQINSKPRISSAMVNLATLDFEQKKYDDALKGFEKAVALNKEIGAQREISYCYLKMGRIYFIKEDYEKALFYAKESEALAEKINVLDYRKDVARLLSEIYYQQQQYKLAFEKQNDHLKLTDSVFSPQNLDKAAQVKYNHAYKEKESDFNKVVASKDGQLKASQNETFWWILGFVCLAILLGFGYALYRIRKVKMENKQLLTEQKLRRSQMNPHFIFNSLQNVRSLINNNQKDEAVNYLNQFTKLTRQILESSDENYTSLAEEIDLLEKYVSIQQLLYNKTFDFKINVDDTIDAEATLLPPMLTQPFIENAIKHGLAAKADGGMLEINFLFKGEKLIFEVADNGSGFDGSKKSENHKSMAMDITRRRLKHFAKNESVEVKAENLFDQYRNIIGAKVAFEIPYLLEA